VEGKGLVSKGMEGEGNGKGVVTPPQKYFPISHTVQKRSKFHNNYQVILTLRLSDSIPIDNNHIAHWYFENYLKMPDHNSNYKLMSAINHLLSNWWNNLLYLPISLKT
jgi:hypothetical protein